MIEKTNADSSWRVVGKEAEKETRDKLYKGKFQLSFMNNIIAKQAVTYRNSFAGEVV